MMKFLSEEECRELKQYNRDKMKSHGYEIGDYPNLEKRGYPGLIHRYYDPPAKTIDPHELNALDDLTHLAIDYYNKREGTCYMFKKVLKAMTKGFIYYITFEASLPDEKAETFRAKVLEKFSYPTTEIDAVRKIRKIKKVKKIKKEARMMVRIINPHDFIKFGDIQQRRV